MDASSIFGGSNISSLIGGIFSTVFSSGFTSIIPLILETIILKFMAVPMYGLRFVPIYGDYYYYSKILPDRKVLAVIYTLCDSFIVIIYAVFALLTMVGIFSSSDVSYIVIMVISVIIVTAGIVSKFVIKIIFNLDMVELFGYDKFLGIVFAIVPLIGPICYLIKAKDGDYAYARDYEDIYNVYDDEDNSEYDDSDDEEYDDDVDEDLFDD